MAKLGLVGISNKGTYDATKAYVQGNFVLYDGSTYVCINADGVPAGTTPSDDGKNWQYLAKGLTSVEAARVGLASSDRPGMVKIGDGTKVDIDGTISVKPATKSAIGGVKVGNGIDVAADGTISAQKVSAGDGISVDANSGAVAVKPATKSAIGGVKIGDGINVSDDGTISAQKIKAGNGISVAEDGTVSTDDEVIPKLNGLTSAVLGTTTYNETPHITITIPDTTA